MRIAPLADVKARLSAYLEQCETEGPIVITRNGKAAAVLLAPMNDDDLEGLLLARSPRFKALLAKSRESIKAGKGLSSKYFWKAVASRQSERGDRKRGSGVSLRGATPPPAHEGTAYWIKLSAQQDGSYTVTNARNGFSKTYTPGK